MESSRINTCFSLLRRDVSRARSPIAKCGGVTFDVGVIRTGYQFCRWMRTTKIGHLFRALIDKQNDQNDLRMIFSHCIGKCDAAALSCRCAAGRQSNRACPIPSGVIKSMIRVVVTVRHRFELDSFVRIDRGQLFKRSQTLIFGGLFTIDLEQLDQLRGRGSRAGFHRKSTCHRANRNARTISGVTKISCGVCTKLRFASRRNPKPLPEISMMPSPNSGFGLNLFAPLRHRPPPPRAHQRRARSRVSTSVNRAGRIGIN